MKKLRGLGFILLFTSCLASQDKRDKLVKDATNPIDAKYCQSSDMETCFGQPIEGGFDGEEFKQSVKVSFVYINSSSKQISFNANNDSQRVIDSLNGTFLNNGHQHLKFSLGTIEEYNNDLYHNTECELLDNILELYGKTDSLTFVMVNDLAGSCRGVAHLWTNPSDRYSGLLLQYNPEIESSSHVYAHEIGHNIGLHHSARTYSESAPVSGLYSFNELLSYGGILSDRCEYDFYYFIDPTSQSTDSIESGMSFNSYENIMYPSYGDGVERNFFNQGYAYSTTRAFDCWYNVVKNSGSGTIEGDQGTDDCSRIELRADYNNDGAITNSDFQAINLLYQQGSTDVRYDFNNNGLFGARDLDLLQQYLLGLICK